MKTMYHARFGYQPQISAVIITAETDKMVTVNSRRRAKLSSDEGYFDTHEQAYKFLSDLAIQMVIDANNKMTYAQERVESVVKLAPNAK